MPVFKVYFKVVRSFIVMILLHVCITMGIVVAVTMNGQTAVDFSATKPLVQIIDNDNTELTKAFWNHVDRNAIISDEKLEGDQLKDALFFAQIDMSLTIPDGFTERFLRGEQPEIAIESRPQSWMATYAEMLFNRFWNVARVYADFDASDMGRISDMILIDLEQQATTTVQSFGSDTDRSAVDRANTFFNFINYSILHVGISIVAILLGAFGKLTLKRRNLISALPLKRINRELFLGGFCVSFGIWAIFMICGFALLGEIMFTAQGGLFVLNSLFLAGVALAIGNLLGNLVHARQAQDGIIQVISLGSSFLSGSFVPQAMLGATVLGFAHILPSYWYILNNNLITEMSSFGLNDVLPLVWNWLVLIGFIIILFVLNNIVSRKRRREE